MIKDFFLLSVNSMKKRKLRSWLTLLGIFVGIAAVVSLISLSDGLRTAITGQFSSLSVDTLTFTNAETGFGAPGSTAIKKINDHDIKLIESVNGVKLVIPRLIRMVKFEYNKIVKFKYVGSLPNEKEKVDFIYKNMNLEAEIGRLLNPGERGKVVLGNDFLKTEDFNKQIRVGSRVKIQGKDFEVVGIIKKTSTFIINGAILMNEDDMKEILNIGDEQDLVVIRVASPDIIEKVAEDIKNKLRKDRKEKLGEEDFNIQTPIEALQAVETILNVINLIVIGIAAISLIVGGLGISNTMYTSILERTKEIGVMKAIGARNSDILKIFVIEAGLFGLVGGVAGALFGVFLSYSVSAIANSYFGENIFAFQISWVLILSAIAFSFL